MILRRSQNRIYFAGLFTFALLRKLVQSQGSSFLHLSAIHSCCSSLCSCQKCTYLRSLPSSALTEPGNPSGHVPLGANPNHTDHRNRHGSGCVNQGSVPVFVGKLFDMAGNHLQVKCYAKAVKLSCKRLCGMVPKVRCMGCIGCDVIISSMYGWNNRYYEGIIKFYHSAQ